MFDVNAPQAAPVRIVRVPMAALASRPHGIAVAAGVVDLAEAIARATAPTDEPTADSDPDVAAEADLIDALSCFERAKSIAEARQVRTIADLARRPMFAGCPEHGEDDPSHGVMAAASVVSAELRISPGHARTRVELACELVECLPNTLEALSVGRIDGYRARVLAEETRPLADTPELRRTVERELLVKAGRQTGPQLRAAARKAVLAADATSAEERHKKARAGRAISPPVPEPNGMASCLIRMAAEDLAAFWAALDAVARRTQNDPEETRTLDQLRADTLAELCWSALEIGHLGCCNPACGHVHQPFGARHGRAATVGVTVAISTLLGIDDHPAHLHGYGPITAETARRIAADGTWRRLLTDPVSGALLDYGTTRYAPPADLVEHVNARDRSCRFPTCTHPAEGCDFDHTVPAAEGGPTSAGNGGPLHRRHHNDKTHHGWWLDQPEPGRFVWTFRTGHSYEVDPEIIGPLLAESQRPDDPAPEHLPREPDPPPRDPGSAPPQPDPPSPDPEPAPPEPGRPRSGLDPPPF
jgi:hypothetical protein